MEATNVCPECSGDVRPNGDESVCASCGLVVAADRLDRGPEWRSFADDETNPKRTGAPLTRSRHDRGLSTEIGSVRATGRKRRQWARLRRQHSRTQIRSKRERNQVYAFTEIRRVVDRLSLPNRVRDGACSLVRSAQDADLLRGRSLEGFAAASVYAAARVQSVARTRAEVVDAARASDAELAAAYDALNRELGLPTGPTDPGEFVPRFASRLGVSAGVERRAFELAERAVEEGVAVGRDPSGVAAGCLYTAAREHDADLTQAEAADAAGVTPVTVRNSYVDLRG
jgi:transcription initiation factor TFIIB